MQRIYAFLWLVLFTILLVAVPQSHAQEGTLSGTVRAGDTGEPLPGANITLQGTSLGGSTTPDGTFRLEQVPSGSHTLRISFVGYETAEREVSVRPDRTTTLSVRLSLSSAEFDEMVVTGSRQEERIANAPVQIEAVNSRDIEANGGETFWSSISSLKGVDIARVGLNQESISMRGFDSHYNSRLVQMKDGYLAQIPGGGVPQVNYVPTSELDVRQIEVVVGPASALYGPNAHTGVVNVLTKTPWDESGVALDVRGGQHDLVDLNARAAGVLGDDLGWKVTGQYMKGTDYRPPTGGPNATAADSTHFYGTSFNENELVDNYSIRSLRTEGSLYYRFGDDWQIEGNYGLSINDNFDTISFGRLRIKDFRLQYQNVEISNNHWSVRATRTRNDGGNSYSIDGTAQVAEVSYLGAVQNGMSPNQARQQVLQRMPALRDSSAFTLEGDLWDTEIRYNNTFGVGAGTIQLQTGAQYRQYSPSSAETFLADVIGRSLDMTERGGYVQLDYRPTDAVRINTAARLDERSEHVQFSPKAAFVVTVAPDHNLRLTYNRAFKNPETIQTHLYLGPARGNYEGFTVRNGPTPNADVVRTIDPLEPEEVNSIELGYRGTFGRRLSVNLVGYNSWYENFVGALTPVADPTAAQPTFGFRNQHLVGGNGLLLTYFNYGEAVVRGFDAGLTYAVHQNLRLHGSASLIERASFTKETAAEPLLLNVPNTKLKGSLTIRNVGIDNYFVRLSGRWKAAHRYRSGYWDSANFYEDGKIPARFSANLTAGYTIPSTDMQIKASATNLLDTQVPDKLGAPQTGRLLWLSATYKFGESAL